MSKKSIIISIAFLILLLASLTLIMDFLRYSDNDDVKPIGIVNIKSGNIKAKLSGTGSWIQLQSGDLINPNTIVLSNSGSSAKYILKNGTVINHSESSMLIIKMDKEDIDSQTEDKDIQLNVVDGSFVFLSDGLSSKSKIKMNDATIEMDKNNKSSIKIDKDDEKMKVFVISGKLDVKTDAKMIEVNAGENIQSSASLASTGEQLKKEKTPELLQEELKKEVKETESNISNYQFIKERSLKYIYRRLFKLLSIN